MISCFPEHCSRKSIRVHSSVSCCSWMACLWVRAQRSRPGQAQSLITLFRVGNGSYMHSTHSLTHEDHSVKRPYDEWSCHVSGVVVSSLDHTKKWLWQPYDTVKKGDLIAGGTIYGHVEENRYGHVISCRDMCYRAVSCHMMPCHVMSTFIPFRLSSPSPFPLPPLPCHSLPLIPSFSSSS